MRLWSAIAFTLLCLPACSAYERRANAVTVSVPGGWVKVEWVSTGAFRFCRGWELPAGCPDLSERDAVTFTDRDEVNSVELRTQEMVVRLDKATGRITVAADGDFRYLEETGATGRTGADVVVRFRSSPRERFQGFGLRNGPVSLGGTRLRTRRGFLMSNRGYGMYFPSPGDYEFDLCAADARVMEVTARGAKHLEYFFYRASTPKETYEEHMTATGQVERLNAREVRLMPPGEWSTAASPLSQEGAPSWSALAATVKAIINGSLSAVLLPAWDLAPWRSAPAQLHRRAAQLAVFMPLIGDSTPRDATPPHPALDTASARLRARLTPFLLTYTLEAHDRGFPVIHPLAMQFPADAHGATLEDEFLFGDEILVAPALGETNRRTVYLPMGRWTNLWTNATYSGKQTIEIDVPEHAPALFVKNGSLIPLDAERPGDPMELHYFPSLGGEFFLAEAGMWYPTQFHASPAGDYYRLETESKQDRDYEWVVHHMARPRQVAEGDDVYLEVNDRAMLANGCWFYDTARENLHVRQRARADADHIINISF